VATAFDVEIALLPPISRGAHLDGPRLHAKRLVELWQVGDGDDVPLREAFRLLEVDAVAGVIWRTVCANDYPGDAHHWTFPPLEDLLLELQQLTWQAMLAGTLITEAVTGVRGKRRRTILSAELPRLTPDWGLSRLTMDGQDEFIDVRIRRAPAEPVKKAWRGRPRNKDLEAAMADIVKGLGPGVRLSSGDALKALQGRFGESVTREQARNALKKYPHVRLQRGYRKSPT